MENKTKQKFYADAALKEEEIKKFWDEEDNALEIKLGDIIPPVILKRRRKMKKGILKKSNNE